MHVSEWPTIEESLEICPPKTRGASRLKPRSRFEVYQPRKRLDGKLPKAEEIAAFKGRVRKLDLNDDILRLVMDHSGNCFESQLLLVQHLELLRQAGAELCFWRHESEKRDKASKRTNAAVDHVYHCTVDGCTSSSDSLQKACQHLTGVHWKLKLFKCTKCPKAWPFGRNATSHEKYDHSPPELPSLHRAIAPAQAFDPASATTAIHPLAPSVPSTTQALEAASSSHQRLYAIQRRPETQASPHAFEPYRRMSGGPVGGASRVHRPAQAPQVSMGTSARGSYAPQHVSLAEQTPDLSSLAQPPHGRGNPQLMVPSGLPYHPLYAHQPYAVVAAGLAPMIGLSGVPASMRMYPTPGIPLVPPVALSTVPRKALPTGFIDS
ncbi:hypothetical protein FRC17_009431 [Serendipita sp. 399]|nr:hypothetical protein FRC17_009431 [Serendipita sp. 399]